MTARTWTRGCLAIALSLLLCAAAPRVFAQDYDAGRAAYINGDYARALEILKPLAEDGNSEAQKLLGIMYDYGHGVKVDPKRALEWYTKSAEQGDPAVQFKVGAKYFRGDGAERNYKEAAKWWELAANGGQGDAQFNLGLMYFRGLGVKHDDARAVELFRRAAEHGDGHAQYSLGVMYAFGRGVEQNYVTAQEWFNKSAAQGVAQAQYNLGVFHENGFGVRRDLAAARQWYERAAAQGLSEARDKLAALDASAGAVSTVTHPAEAAISPVLAQPAPASAPAPVATPEKHVAAAGPARAAPPAPSTRVFPKLPPAAQSVNQRGAQWILSQRPDSYTLQIGSVTSEQEMLKFLHNAGIEADATYIEVEINGVKRYNAFYGVYDNYAAANAAVADPPINLRGVKPWIRNFGVLQKMLQ